jgi:hypothetical protein
VVAPAEITYDPKYALRDVVDGWVKRIEASRSSTHRIGFMRTAATCNEFFAGSMETMWSDKFRIDYLNGIPAPKFKLTVAKAFELVALYMPSICWDYPGFVNKAYKRKTLPRSIFGKADDQSAEERYQAYLVELSEEQDRSEARCELMSQYQNYAQREQPAGMLAESYRAITDALVKGRGCMQVEPYSFPGSERVLTRATSFSVEDLFLDPDCRRSDWQDCYWVARRHVTPYRELEKKFDLPKNSLKKYCNKEGASSINVNNTNDQQARRMIGLMNNRVEWYEIYSKMGVGTQDMENREDLDSTFDELLGDYAYICVVKDLPWILNLPPDKFKKDPKIAKEALQWPVPYHKDARWPIAKLDFHERTDSAWPIAPMAMGLGELVIMNVLMSVFAERAYAASRTFGVVSKSLGPDVIERLKNVDFGGWLEVPGEVAENVKNMIAFIESPQMTSDLFEVLDRVSALFDKRTGLTDLLYGLNPGGKVSRSAADINIKQQAVSIRPDWMSRCFNKFMTDIGNLIRIAAGWTVEGQDIDDLLGPTGAQAWDTLIRDEDPEVYVRQMRSTVEANSIQKPDKFRDNANLQQTISYVLPILKEYWQMKGDAKPLNNYLSQMADAMEQDWDSWQLPDVEPPAPPEPDPAQQEQQQLQLQSLQEGLRGKQLRNEKLESESTGPVALPPELPMAPPAAPGDFPMEPELPVEQRSSPEEVQMILERMAASGAL